MEKGRISWPYRRRTQRSTELSLGYHKVTGVVVKHLQQKNLPVPVSCIPRMGVCIAEAELMRAVSETLSRAWQPAAAFSYQGSCEEEVHWAF